MGSKPISRSDAVRYRSQSATCARFRRWSSFLHRQPLGPARPAHRFGSTGDAVPPPAPCRSSLQTRLWRSIVGNSVDRQHVVSGQGGYVRVDIGGRRIIKKKKKKYKYKTTMI